MFPQSSRNACKSGSRSRGRGTTSAEGPGDRSSRDYGMESAGRGRPAPGALAPFAPQPRESDSSAGETFGRRCQDMMTDPNGAYFLLATHLLESSGPGASTYVPNPPPPCPNADHTKKANSQDNTPLQPRIRNRQICHISGPYLLFLRRYDLFQRHRRSGLVVRPCAHVLNRM